MKLRGVPVGVMAFLLGAAVVYAMPNSIALSATTAAPHHGSGTAGGPTREETSETDAPDTEANGHPDREGPSTGAKPAGAQGAHGAAISALAHCAIKGAEHGALVSSAAAMPDATVAGSTAACSRAGAAIQEPGEIAHGPNQVHGQSGASHGKSAAAHQSQVHPSRS